MRAEGAMQRAYIRRQTLERRSIGTEVISQRGKTLIGPDGIIAPPTLPMIVRDPTGPMYCQAPYSLVRAVACQEPAYLDSASVMDSHDGGRARWACLVGHGGWVRLSEKVIEPVREHFCHCGCGQLIEEERVHKGNIPQYRKECLIRRERNRARERSRERARQIDKSAAARAKRLLTAKYCVICNLRIMRWPQAHGQGWRHNACRSVIPVAVL